MKKLFMPIFLVSILLLQIVFIAASASDLRQDWKDLKEVSREKQQLHREAKQVWRADKTDENNQAVVDTGKETLHAALNEAEAWLNWKRAEAEENEFAPEDIKQDIYDDVEANLAKVEDLRTQVDEVDTQLELGITFLTMIGKYFELLTDVARNSGKMWVHIANTRADKLEEFEQKLRDAAEDLDDNEEIIEELDDAKRNIESARENIEDAEAYYEDVQVGGTPLIKFGEGNKKLRNAREEMLQAGSNLRQAFRLITK